MISIRESGGDETRTGVVIDATNQEEAGHKEGVMVNFALRWKESKRDCSISIISPKGWKPSAICGDDQGKFFPIAAFECRGCEPYEYTPEDQWEVKSKGGSTYEVDLSDEWTDYCEKLGESVSVFKAKGRFVLRRDLS